MHTLFTLKRWIAGVSIAVSLLGLTLLPALMAADPALRPVARVTSQDLTTSLAQFLNRFRILTKPVYGQIAQNRTGITDASVQNQWNLFSVTILANTLRTDGDVIEIDMGGLLGANGDTKGFQMYWGGTTCGGTGASMCTGGCQIIAGTTSVNNGEFRALYSVTRTGSATQRSSGQVAFGTNTQGSNQACTITDTAAADIVMGFRDTTAAGASIQTGAILTVNYSGI